MEIENTERAFKGVWIPAELWDLWRSKQLTSNELLLLLEIDSFTSHDRDCFISNAYISKLLGISERASRNALSTLIKKGYVENVSFDGRKRTIKSLLNTDCIKAERKQSSMQSGNISQELNQNSLQSGSKVPCRMEEKFHHTNNNITNNKLTNIIKEENIKEEIEDDWDDDDSDLPFGYTEEEKRKRREERIKQRELEKQLQNPIYEGLNISADMLEIINEWKAYKKERRQTYTPKGERMFVQKLLDYSKGCIDVARQIVENSIANNYAGIFAPKPQQTNRTGVMLNVNDLWK